MDDVIGSRFASLQIEGNALVQALPLTGGSSEQVVSKARDPEYRAWLMSVAHLVQTATTSSESFFIEECNRILNDPDLIYRVPSRVVMRMYGLLESAKKEWDNGLFQKIEYVIAAETFDGFLDHAVSYHKGNRKIEAAVLASAVLEDTMKKIAKKSGLAPSGRSLEQTIEDLVKANVFTEVKAKRVKAFASVRNYALHAEWDEFDIKDVGEQIKGIQELIENYL